MIQPIISGAHVVWVTTKDMACFNPFHVKIKAVGLACGIGEYCRLENFYNKGEGVSLCRFVCHCDAGCKYLQLRLAHIGQGHLCDVTMIVALVQGT